MHDWDKALDVQVDLISWWRSPAGTNWGSSWAQDSSLFEPAENWGPEMANVLTGAETFWVAPEMAALAAHEAAEMDWPLEEQFLPTPSGFAYLAEAWPIPLHGPLEAVQAFTWAIVESGEQHRSIILVFYGRAEDDEGFRQQVRAPLMMGHVETWNVGSAPEEGDHPKAALQRAVLAFWLLSMDTVAVQDERPVERHVRRRAGRAGLEHLQAVQVITLRRPEPRRKTEEPSAVEWSHRWPVRSHWRRQWYPSDQTHRPKRIPLYVKGPEDKPIVFRDRVYRWVR